MKGLDLSYFVIYLLAQFERYLGHNNSTTEPTDNRSNQATYNRHRDQSLTDDEAPNHTSCATHEATRRREGAPLSRLGELVLGHVTRLVLAIVKPSLGSEDDGRDDETRGAWNTSLCYMTEHGCGSVTAGGCCGHSRALERH